MRNLMILAMIALSSMSSHAQNTVYRGKGVVYLKKSLTEDMSLSDTMSIYSTKSFSKVQAKFVFNMHKRFGSKVLGDNISENTFFEFGYESFGLPVSKAASQFLEVIYGIDSEGSELKGYVKRHDNNYGFREWAPFFLKNQPIFFSRGSSLDFFDKYCGEQINIPTRKLDNGDSDYVMYPLEIKKSWMKVKLVTPSDYCDNPESPDIREVWIKYLDDQGNLRVWYSVRGC